MTDQIKNLGIAPGPQMNPTAYIAGTLPYQVVIPDGNWKKYLPDGERQSSAFADSMACVTFSLLNIIETQELQQTGKQPNYSDRWIAKMSGTTKEGNYLYKVADTVRKYGLVLEEDYPSPTDFTWDGYYADIPQEKMDELLAKGQEWLKTHTLQYEFIDLVIEEVVKALKQVPLQVIRPGHAIEEFNSLGDVMEYFDTYIPFEKQAPQNSILYALKPILTIKGNSMIEFVHITGSQEYGFLETTNFSKVLHRAVNENHLIVLSDVFKVEIVGTDGKIDYTKAREITI